MKNKIGMSLLVLSLGLGVACTKKASNQGNVIRTPLKDDVKTLDPANAYDSVSNDVLPQILEAPLQYSFTNQKAILEPLVAESLPEYSKDGLTVTLKIKKGILFQDDPCFKENGGKGRELKIHDFIFGFKRLALPTIQSQGAWVFDGKVVGFSEYMKKFQAAKKEDYAALFAESIPGFVAKDDYTLEIKLTQPYPILNYIFAMGFTNPIAKEAVDMYADSDGNLRDHPVGTGPFKLKSWETNQRLILVKNPNYHGKYPTDADEFFKSKGFLADAGKSLPMADEIHYIIIKEDMPRFLNFEKGDLDRLELTKDTFASAMIDANTLKPELVKKGIEFTSEDTLINYYVGFNVKDKTLSNKYLRQAISSAIDREKWINTFLKFSAVKQFEVSPPGLLDRAESKQIKYDFDLKKSKELLAKAGYPEGKGLPILNFDFRGADTRYRQMGEMFVQQLGAVGIKVNVILNTFPAYLEKAKQANLQIFLGGWSYDYPDLENGYQLLYGANISPGPNDTLWVNPQFDSLYQQMAKMPAGKKGRSDLVRKLEDVVQEEVPWAYGYCERTYNLVWPRLKNHRVAEIVGNKYKYMHAK